MDLDKQVTTAHLLLETRVCRVCGEEKNLLDDYYFVRKDRALPSSYSYECKACTVERTTNYNKRNSNSVRSQYLKRNYGLSFEEFVSYISDNANELSEDQREKLKMLFPDTLDVHAFFRSMGINFTDT